MRAVEAQELLLWIALGERHPVDVRTKARPDRDLQIALELECPAGTVLHQPLDLALVAVRIERGGENRHREDQEDHEARDHVERNPDSFHRLISKL